MICPQCGTENVENASFCGKCGRDLRGEDIPQQPGQQQVVDTQTPKRLVRCSDDKMVGGVSSGLARYSNMDVGLMRLLTVLSFLITGSTTFWAYIIMWIILPEEPCGPPPQ
ncbi:MAG: PspC domain-containing protein [Candidatus Heimdallarchaeota archaeon]